MAEDLKPADEKIRSILQSYLQDIQKEYKYLPKETLLAIADHVGKEGCR